LCGGFLFTFIFNNMKPQHKLWFHINFFFLALILIKIYRYILIVQALYIPNNYAIHNIYTMYCLLLLNLILILQLPHKVCGRILYPVSS